MPVSKLSAGPWQGVRNTIDPGDDPANPAMLQDASNVYTPDGSAPTGLYARPGFVATTPTYTTTAGQASVEYTMTTLDGTVLRFFATNGKLYRLSGAGLATSTDVTPAVGVITTSLSLVGTTNTITVPASTINISGTNYALAADTNKAISATGNTIKALKWGLFTIERVAAGTTTFVGAAGNSVGYATEVLAMAAKPAQTAGKVRTGFVTLVAGVSDWVGGTDGLTGGSGGTVATTTNFYAEPVSIAISTAAAPTARFYMTGFADELIFSDGVNRPWRGTNLSAAEVTGTYIDIDGVGSAWTCQGAPVVYDGALCMIYKTTPSGSSAIGGCGFAWSEPFQPDIGYLQVGYANFWNLIQTSSTPLYALWPTNTYLYYFREFAIGAIAGAPNVDFSSTASVDAVSVNVGCTAPASICQFGDTIFFVDSIGRPHSFSGTMAPRELWKQLRGEIDATPSYIGNPTATALIGIGVVVPQLNVVLLGGWSSNPTNTPPLPPTTLYCFDAKNGQYYGTWSAATACGLTTFDTLATIKDAANAVTICAFSAGTTKKLFTLSLLSGANWLDNAVVPTISAKTQRLGYSVDEVMTATGVGTILTQSTAPLTISVITPYTASTVEATAMAGNSSQDSTYRTVFGMDVRKARGIQVVISPTTAATQWVLQSVEFPVVKSKTASYDQ
jgi:hypothetical protein